jgi:hypothetical protein
VAEGGAPGGAAPYVTGRARFSVPREVGPLTPPQRVPRKHSGASRRSIALAHCARDTGKPRTHCAARMQRPGCLKLWIGNEQDSAIYSASRAGLTRLRGRSRFGEAKARASIILRKSLSKRMDGRVKPGHDESPFPRRDAVFLKLFRL